MVKLRSERASPARFEPITPFKGFWFHPRTAMKSIMDDAPNQLVFVLLAIYMILTACSTIYRGELVNADDFLISNNMDDIGFGGFTVVLWIGLAFISMVILGIVINYMHAILMMISGNFVGADSVSIGALFSAGVWSSLPYIVALFMENILNVITYGLSPIFGEVNPRDNSLSLSLYNSTADESTIVGLYILAGIWSFSIYLGAIAEVQRLSVFKAAINLVFCAVLYVAISWMFIKIFM